MPKGLGLGTRGWRLATVYWLLSLFILSPISPPGEMAINSEGTDLVQTIDPTVYTV
jgi:hypothetical protein